MTKLKEKLQTKGEILDKLYVQKTPLFFFNIIKKGEISNRVEKKTDCKRVAFDSDRNKKVRCQIKFR